METKQLIEVTCPDCRGPLSENRGGSLHEYRCLVGHSYSARSVLQAHSESQERALWAAVVALEESANLVHFVATEFPDEVTRSLQAQAAKKLEQASAIRKVIEQLEPFRIE